MMFHKQKVDTHVIPDCADCDRAVAFLEKCDVSLTVHALERGSDELRELTERTGRSSFPIIVVDDVVSGGIEVIDEASIGPVSSEVFRKKRVGVYTIPDCSFCAKALGYLRARDIDPVVHVLRRGSREVESLKGRTGSSTFPQIFVESKFIGGFDALRETTLEFPTPFRAMEMSGEIKEPMCTETEAYDRFITFNGRNEGKYADIYELFKKQTALFWVPEEIDMTPDVNDWENKINDNERKFITHVLAFFASLDQMVMENIGVNFGDEIKVSQIRQHFSFQGGMEAIHADTYSILIQSLIKDRSQQLQVLSSIQTMPIIEKKAVWVERWMNPDTASLAERLIGFTCLEGIQFSGSFCAIYWLKKRGLFPGLCHANTLIARDEGIHAEASVMIYKHLENKLPVGRVHEIVGHAVDIECEFIEESLPVALIGIKSSSMVEYIKFVADFWLTQLEYPKIYGVENPFEWMELISLQGKTNFFEHRVAEYSMAGVCADGTEQGFSTDVAF
jgi:ribonucleotide reductase beta subunit family protein with ferritin-like domain/glutaredoxin